MTTWRINVVANFSHGDVNVPSRFIDRRRDRAIRATQESWTWSNVYRFTCSRDFNDNINSRSVALLLFSDRRHCSRGSPSWFSLVGDSPGKLPSKSWDPNPKPLKLLNCLCKEARARNIEGTVPLLASLDRFLSVAFNSRSSESREQEGTSTRIRGRDG